MLFWLQLGEVWFNIWTTVIKESECDDTDICASPFSWISPQCSSPNQTEVLNGDDLNMLRSLSGADHASIEDDRALIFWLTSVSSSSQALQLCSCTCKQSFLHSLELSLTYKTWLSVGERDPTAPLNSQCWTSGVQGARVASFPGTMKNSACVLKTDGEVFFPPPHEGTAPWWRCGPLHHQPSLQCHPSNQRPTNGGVHQETLCSSKPEGGTATLPEPGYPTPPLPFLSLLPRSLPPLQWSQQCCRDMPATLIIALGEERGMQQEREGRRVGKRAHIVQQDIEADVEECDIYSTAGGTAGQPATGVRQGDDDIARKWLKANQW